MSWRTLYRLGDKLGAAIIAMGMLGVPALSLAADNMTPDLLDSLRAEAAKAGTARVIVKYRWSPERAFRLRERLSPAQRRAQAERRAQLSSMRNRLMKRLDEGSGRLRTYCVLPFEALRVTDAGLDALIDDPDVEAVYPVRYYRASLGSTVPLIGANILHNQGITGVGQTVVIADTGVRATMIFSRTVRVNPGSFTRPASRQMPPAFRPFAPTDRKPKLAAMLPPRVISAAAIMALMLPGSRRDRRQRRVSVSTAWRPKRKSSRFRCFPELTILELAQRSGYLRPVHWCFRRI